MYLQTAIFQSCYRFLLGVDFDWAISNQIYFNLNHAMVALEIFCRDESNRLSYGTTLYA